MKRVSIILAMLAGIIAFAACEMEVPEDAFGSTTTPNNPVQAYMMNIADDLVCDNLRELESALKASAESGLGKYFYTTNDRPLDQDGAEWTVNREGNLTGLTIKKVAGSNAWDLEFNGKYPFSGNKYEIVINLTAEQDDASATGHQNWKVVFDGTRTEENGYKCTFSSVDAPVKYKTIGEDNNLWNAFGYLLMTVFKGGTQVDKVVMELAGGKSDSSIVHI